MRNLLEIAIKNQANRLMEYEERSKNDLSYLTINDFMLDLQQLKRFKVFVGFNLIFKLISLNLND